MNQGGRTEPTGLQEVQPKLAFVSLLRNDGSPRDKLTSRPTTARCTMVCRYASSSPKQLRTDQAAQISIAKLKTKLDYVKGKLPRP